jgi:outer membrane lipoprotein-sorting protein
MRTVLITLGVLVLSVGFSNAFAGEKLSAQAIVAKANLVSYYQGQDGRARVKMTIDDKKGKPRLREFIILRKDANIAGQAYKDAHCGDQKMYVYFTAPADLNKMVFLVWKRIGKDDDRWLYTPGLDLVNRIAASDERTSFVGSDFFYEDVSGRGTAEDNHEILEETKLYYVLKSTPKKPKSVEFSYYKVWIIKSNFLPRQIQFFDSKQQKYREYMVEGVKKVQGYWTVTKASMSDLKTGSKTTLEYSDIKYDIGVPEKVFTERYLKRRPRKYLK